MNNPRDAHKARQRASFLRTPRTQLALGFDPLRLPAASRDKMKFVPLADQQPAEYATAKPMRLFQYRVEHGREVAGRAVDDLQHLSGRSLLLQRFARLGEEPRVLHRYDVLGREVLQEGDLLVGERANLLAVHDKGAEHLAFLEQWHVQRGANAASGPGCLGWSA